MIAHKCICLAEQSPLKNNVKKTCTAHYYLPTLTDSESRSCFEPHPGSVQSSKWPLTFMKTLNTSTDKTMWEEQKLVIDDISRKGSVHDCRSRFVSFKLASFSSGVSRKGFITLRDVYD